MLDRGVVVKYKCEYSQCHRIRHNFSTVTDYYDEKCIVNLLNVFLSQDVYTRLQWTLYT